MTFTAIAAQCVMCFRTAAAQQGERSRVLNAGIVILLIPPLAILAGILTLGWYRSRRNNQRVE
jgi:hypothetical protein